MMHLVFDYTLKSVAQLVVNFFSTFGHFWSCTLQIPLSHMPYLASCSSSSSWIRSRSSYSWGRYFWMIVSVSTVTACLLSARNWWVEWRSTSCNHLPSKAWKLMESGGFSWSNFCLLNFVSNFEFYLRKGLRNLNLHREDH